MNKRTILGAFVAMLAVLGLAAVATAGLGKNPADHRSLVNKPIEGYSYDRADHCTKKVPKGTRALVNWLERHTRGSFWGITRCEKLSRGNYSLHAEGRAIDWAMDSRNRKDHKQAMTLIRKRLLASDRRGNENALARRMGVQGIIYDCKQWFASPGGLSNYSYCYKPNGKRRRNVDPTAAHMDHIHIELSKAGARKRTSFWRSPISRR